LAVTKQPNRCVAAGAQKPANASSGVIVIDAQLETGASLLASTNRAQPALLCEHALVVGDGYAVLVFEVTLPKNFRVGLITDFKTGSIFF